MFDPCNKPFFFFFFFFFLFISVHVFFIVIIIIIVPFSSESRRCAGITLTTLWAILKSTN